MADLPGTTARLHFVLVVPETREKKPPAADEAESTAELSRLAHDRAERLFPGGHELETFEVVPNLTNEAGETAQWAAAVVARGRLPEQMPADALVWDVRLAQPGEEPFRG